MKITTLSQAKAARGQCGSALQAAEGAQLLRTSEAGLLGAALPGAALLGAVLLGGALAVFWLFSWSALPRAFSPPKKCKCNLRQPSKSCTPSAEQWQAA